MNASHASASQIAEALDWLVDCFGDELPEDITPDEIFSGVERHYEGGWACFLTSGV